MKRRLRRRQYHSKGPDFLWHIDSYDKLKQYGLYASTDLLTGFREKSYGLMCTKPAVTPVSLQDTISKQCPNRGVCPAFMRGDNVTENGIVAQMQEFLSGNNTFFYEKKALTINV